MDPRRRRPHKDHEEGEPTVDLSARIASCRAMLLSAHRRLSAMLFSAEEFNPDCRPFGAKQRYTRLIVVPLSVRECAQAIELRDLDKCELLQALSKDNWQQQNLVVEAFLGLENRLAVRVQTEFANSLGDKDGADGFVARRHILVAQSYVTESQTRRYDPPYTLYFDDTVAHLSDEGEPTFLGYWRERFWDLMKR